ncbi:hypothetical protein ABKN59_009616 [Abortiporus biennis]
MSTPPPRFINIQNQPAVEEKINEYLSLRVLIHRSLTHSITPDSLLDDSPNGCGVLGQSTVQPFNNNTCHLRGGLTKLRPEPFENCASEPCSLSLLCIVHYLSREPTAHLGRQFNRLGRVDQLKASTISPSLSVFLRFRDLSCGHIARRTCDLFAESKTRLLGRIVPPGEKHFLVSFFDFGEEVSGCRRC